MAEDTASLPAFENGGAQGLPLGWEWVPLRDLCLEVVGGGTPKRDKSEYFGGEIVWVTPSDLDAGKPDQVILSSRVALTDLGLNSSSARVVPAGTVLYSTRATIGKVGIAGVKLCTNQGFANFVCNNGLNNKYLAWCLHFMTDEIRKLAGSTTYLEVSRGNLKNFRIPIPYPGNVEVSLDLQHRIVERIGSLLAEVRESRKLLDEMRRDAEQVMDAALEEVFENPPKEWKLATLGETLRLKSGQFLRQEDMKSFGKFAVYGGNGKIGNHDSYLFEEPKVVIGRVGAKCGCVHISKPYSWVTDNALYVDKKLVPIDDDFLRYLLSWVRLNDYAKRAAQPVISGQVIYPIEIRYPQDLYAQRLIARRIDSISEELGQVVTSINNDSNLMNELEQAILEQAFRGEL